MEKEEVEVEEKGKGGKNKKAAVASPRVQLRGNYHQAPLHLCTNNPTAAGINTGGAEEQRRKPRFDPESRLGDRDLLMQKVSLTPTDAPFTILNGASNMLHLV